MPVRTAPFSGETRAGFLLRREIAATSVCNGRQRQVCEILAICPIYVGTFRRLYSCHQVNSNRKEQSGRWCKL